MNAALEEQAATHASELAQQLQESEEKLAAVEAQRTDAHKRELEALVQRHAAEMEAAASAAVEHLTASLAQVVPYYRP